MSDNASSSGKSKEEVAFDILSKLKGVGIWGENNKDAILDMYAECLQATSGQRHINTRQAAAAAPVAPQREYAPAQKAAAPQPGQPMTPLQAELHNLQQALNE